MVKATAKKSTMVKDVVGRVRTSTRELPPSGHTYGAIVRKDSEGAGAVISTWDMTKPPAAKKSERDMIKTNVLAIQHGNITAKDARLFAQAHPEIRFTPPSSSITPGEGRKRDKIPFEGPYGTKTERMPCPLSALIEARFTDLAGEGKDYPDVSVLEKKIRIPPPRETKASEGHNMKLKPPPREPSKFIMKRFRNVSGKVNAPNPGREKRTARTLGVSDVEGTRAVEDATAAQVAPTTDGSPVAESKPAAESDPNAEEGVSVAEASPGGDFAPAAEDT